MNKFVSILKSLSLPVVAVIILVIVLIFTREFKRNEICPPEGYALISDNFIDSLTAIANMPPDTIRDTLFLKGDIVYLPGKEVPVPVPVDAKINFYADSIVNDSVSVWVEITVRGIITKWDWKYQPIIIKESVTIKIPVIKPVPYEVSISKSGMYASLGIGGNQSAFILFGGIDYINRKDKLYGVQLMRWNEQNYYLFRLGTKIKLRR